MIINSPLKNTSQAPKRYAEPFRSTAKALRDCRSASKVQQSTGNDYLSARPAIQLNRLRHFADLIEFQNLAARAAVWLSSGGDFIQRVSSPHIVGKFGSTSYHWIVTSEAFAIGILNEPSHSPDAGFVQKSHCL